MRSSTIPWAMRACFSILSTWGRAAAASPRSSSCRATYALPEMICRTLRSSWATSAAISPTTTRRSRVSLPSSGSTGREGSPRVRHPPSGAARRPPIFRALARARNVVSFRSGADPRPPMASAHPDNKIGSGTLLVGKYRVTRELGRGGMAAVYEAEHVNIGKRVAIKVLAAELVELRDRHRALHSRGARGGECEEPLHRRGVRLGSPRRRAALHRHGAARGRIALRPDGARAPHRSGDDRPHHRAGRQGPDEGPRHRASFTAISSPRTSTSARAKTARRSPRSSISGSPSSTRPSRPTRRRRGSRGRGPSSVRRRTCRPSRSRARGASIIGPISGRSAAWPTSA